MSFPPDRPHPLCRGHDACERRGEAVPYGRRGAPAFIALGLATVLGLAWMQGSAQDALHARRHWIDAAMPVSDDPRRVPVAPGPRGPEGMIVLRGGRVFDGTGAAARPATLVIERNKISALLPPSSTQWPADARIIDATGKTVMPGLIDLHTHLTYTEGAGYASLDAQDGGLPALYGAERLRFYIASGITSVRDLAGIGHVPFLLKRWVDQNRIPGPRVFPAGQLITGTGGHGAEGIRARSRDGLLGAIREASGPDDWREAVREQFKRGADVIKLASHFSREEAKAAVDEAHALGLPVTCDCETFYIQWAVEAGVDGIEHPLPRTEETVRLMAERGTVAVPTLVPYVYIFDARGGYYGSTSRRFDFSKEANLALFGRMRRTGIRMGVGTDLLGSQPRSLPEPYIAELQQFVAGGYGAAEALEAATRVNAQILGMEDKLGTLEAGKLADVIVVDGRPDQRLEDLAAVSLVIRDGHVIVEDGRLDIRPPVPAPNSR